MGNKALGQASDAMLNILTDWLKTVVFSLRPLLQQQIEQEAHFFQGIAIS